MRDPRRMSVRIAAAAREGALNVAHHVGACRIARMERSRQPFGSLALLVLLGLAAAASCWELGLAAWCVASMADYALSGWDVACWGSGPLGWRAISHAEMGVVIAMAAAMLASADTVEEQGLAEGERSRPIEERREISAAKLARLSERAALGREAAGRGARRGGGAKRL